VQATRQLSIVQHTTHVELRRAPNRPNDLAAPLLLAAASMAVVLGAALALREPRCVGAIVEAPP
jgi:hypothetical protein